MNGSLDSSKIAEFIIEKLNPVFAYMLDCTREENIVEIAYFSDSDYDESIIYKLEEDLSSYIGSQIIINNLKNTNSDFICEVLEEWDLLYSANDTKKHLFEMSLAMELEKLNTMRKNTIDRIKQTGTHYIQ